MTPRENRKLKETLKKVRGAAKTKPESSEVEYGDDYINIICASRRIKSEEDAIKAFKVDTEKWEVESFKVKTSEGYRKDRKISWHVVDGKVLKGDVEDSGNLLIAPLYHVQIRFKRRTQEIIARVIIKQWIEDAKKHSPKVQKINYGRVSKGMTFEIGIPDIHFGRETWAEESGADYNMQIARQAVHSTLDELLGFAQNIPLRRIVLPIGNDFYNVDTMENTTTHGTPQQEEGRWARTFRSGYKLAFEMIDKCAQVAPVDVIIVSGNHDEQRTFYLGEIIDTQYQNNRNVSVDNRAIKRKYYGFEKNLIGFAHGYHEKIDSLSAVMPLEAPDLWAKSTNREFHLGDKHHKKKMQFQEEDILGVTVRILRSLSAADVWTFDKGFVGSPRASEGFLWDNEYGVVHQFTAILKKENINGKKKV